jgi:hypothetical protein
VPPVPPPAKRPNRRLRLILALGAGILTLLCLGGVGVFISLYDEATEIKRAAPDAVVDSYLRAYLVNRDDDETRLYTCKSGGDFTAIEAFRTEILNAERANSTNIQVSWADLRVSTSNATGSVEVDLTRSVASREQLTDTWQVAVVDEDGWRVCGASRVA